MSKFTLEYDDQLDDAVDKISKALIEFGLEIDYSDEGGDGYQGYTISKIEE